ncbi:MAG: rRNA maturation RNase YbeY [Bacteroidales bacterium]
MVNFFTENVKTPNLKKKEIKEWIKLVAKLHGKRVGDVNYIFCDDAKILEVNNQYLQHDYYTDIITFDYTEGAQIAGDIFISLDTVRSNAVQFNTDNAEELHRIIIHGILHLCGFEDKSDETRTNMTRLENEALALNSFL